MSSLIYRRIPACDPALVAEAAKYSVADLHESMDSIPGRMALLNGSLLPLKPGLKAAGQAVTAYCFPGDGLLAHKAVSLLQPGQFLLMTNGGSGPQTMFAELIALAARQRGAVGAVVEGAVRDSEALRAMDFPVWCNGIYPGRTGKNGPGSVNIPIVIGGVRVHPGDIIVADDDGVICIAPSELPAVLKKAAARAAREVEVRAAIAKGKLLFDMLGLQKVLDDGGAVELDRNWVDQRDS